MISRREFGLASAALACAQALAAEGPASKDARLGNPKTLNDSFGFTPPKSLAAWQARKALVREQVAVALGLWPLPDKTPLNAVVRGKVERDGYSVEKVHFESVPGHLVTGNLYRPTAPRTAGDGKRPAVLFAHGHWADGRLHDAGEAAAKAAVARGEESDFERGRFFMQAIPVTLARLGFVVFQHDMVGYAESTAIPHVLRSGVAHPDGFADVAGELRLQSLTGLQTWNSVRALDFLAGLPDVDPKRLAVTGASGGGTQTFLLAAIDDRIQAAFPAVMVSVGMQGGCVCENASHLRRGTGNIELAGLIAPKPVAMSGANDWTREVMTKGLPELRRLYKMHDAEENVAAKAWVQFPHNYGQPSREFMYSWFRNHLLSAPGPVAEAAFAPTPVAELRVFDATHPRPAGELGAKDLRAAMAKASDAQLAALPAEAKAKVVAGALRAMLGTALPEIDAVAVGDYASTVVAGCQRHAATLSRAGSGEAVPAVGYVPAEFDHAVAVLWLHPDGVKSLEAKGAPTAEVAALVKAGVAVLAIDAFGCGVQRPRTPRAVDKNYAGFTFGYNRALVAERVHDVLTALGNLRDNAKVKAVHLVGFGDLGPVALLAAALAPGAFGKVVADANRFRFDAIPSMDDPMMLPGAVKYGGLPGLTAPGSMANVYNAAGTGLAGASDKPLTVSEVVERVLATPQAR